LVSPKQSGNVLPLAISLAKSCRDPFKALDISFVGYAKNGECTEAEQSWLSEIVSPSAVSRIELINLVTCLVGEQDTRIRGLPDEPCRNESDLSAKCVEPVSNHLAELNGPKFESLNLNYDIIGSSSRTRELKKLIAAIAPSDGSVLITGESGCGKELYARAIHKLSDRAHKPFVAINCGAIPAELLESQLFGHKKGSFTGAIADFKGKFQDADGGTLFLDEIGDMPYEMQVKLLRVLQERTITPIGSNQLIEIDVRVLAATHRDVEKDIETNRFRQDLYFRLNVLPLVIPSLRDRPSEISELTSHFAELFRHAGHKPITFTKSFMEMMEIYDWPGNVRELSNTIHRFSILYSGQELDPSMVDTAMLPAGMRDNVEWDPKSSPIAHIEEKVRDTPNYQDLEHDMPDQNETSTAVVDPEFESIVLLAQGFGGVEKEKPSLKSMLGDIEQDLISKALNESGGNVSRCAKLLKMQRTTLIERIKKYDLGAT